jgi:predicted nucleotidyltransferase component of viral defense system
MILPIDKKLKKRTHKSIALAQDILIIEIYNSFSNAIVHGGTALWRCYGSNRFSEDIDVYLPLNVKEANLENFINTLKRKDFVVNKFKKTNNSIFAKFSYLNVVVRFEAVFKNIKDFITKNFEMSDGTSIIVNTLQPEEIIKEKVSAYIKRKKIRDLYDIFFLLKFVEDKEKIKTMLIKFLKEFTNPVDENELKVLIISGAVPKVKDMIEAVRKWVK